MTTINISLPDKLKTQADGLIKSGYYVSFSDLVRDSLRCSLKKNKYNLMAEDVEKDYKKGKAIVINNKKELKKYFDSL